MFQNHHWCYHNQNHHWRAPRKKISKVFLMTVTSGIPPTDQTPILSITLSSISDFWKFPPVLAFSRSLKYKILFCMRIECTLINDDGRHVLRHRDGVDNCSDCPWRHGFKDTSSGSISSINMGGKYLFLNICLYVLIEAPFCVIVPKNNYVTDASLCET